jgi:hypothetical protein
MVFGHNTNVSLGQAKYHVQTEDAGIASALIDTTVYCGGRVLHRRTNNYLDLLPLNPDRQEALKLRLDEQHRQVLEDIRNGSLYLPPATPAQSSLPSTTATVKTAISPSTLKNIAVQPPEPLSLELVNAKTWLTGKRATLHLRVTDRSGHPVIAAKVTATVFGAPEASNLSTESNVHGEAHFAFDMPRLSDATAALLIEATHSSAKGHLRFQLRARQRVSAN